LRLALSNGPNRVGVSHPPPEDRNRSSFWYVVFLGYRTMGKSKNPAIPSAIHHRQSPSEYHHPHPPPPHHHNSMAALFLVFQDTYA
jgi:hypothetical protein